MLDRRGLIIDLGLYALSAVFALLTALTATLPPHRPWGAIAAVGYAIATLIVVGQLVTRRAGHRTAVTLYTWGTTARLPLVFEAAQRCELSTPFLADTSNKGAGSFFMWHDEQVSRSRV